MGMLTRGDIQAARVRLEKVETPEWGEGGFVYVRSLTLADRNRYSKLVKADDPHAEAVFVAMTMCDEKGQLIFGPDDPADIEILENAQGSGTAADRVAKAALALNGMSKDAAETAEKN